MDLQTRKWASVWSCNCPMSGMECLWFSWSPENAKSCCPDVTRIFAFLLALLLMSCKPILQFAQANFLLVPFRTWTKQAEKHIRSTCTTSNHIKHLLASEKQTNLFGFLFCIRRTSAMFTPCRTSTSLGCGWATSLHVSSQTRYRKVRTPLEHVLLSAVVESG